jgi:hypothetical protein
MSPLSWDELSNDNFDILKETTSLGSPSDESLRLARFL